MQLASILAPVAEDLQHLEEMLRQIAEVEEPTMASLLRHVLDNRGKRLRPALLLMSAKFRRYDRKRLLPVATAVELLHTATLIHDDFIDNSPKRRGSPTLNTLVCDRATVLVGDYLFAKAAVLATASQSLRAMEIFGRTLMTICQGELRQSFSPQGWQLDLEEYYRRISSKTAALFATAGEIGAVLSEVGPRATAALRDFCQAFGMAFQIVDDILDFVGEEEELGKPVGSDLRQGTLTLPALWLLPQLPADNPILAVLQGDEGELEENLRRSVELVRNSPAIEASHAVAADFVAKAKACLRPLPDNGHRQAMFQLADYILHRRH